MATTYEVLVDELTVLRQTGELTDPISGRVIGIQQGQGKTYFKGEKIPEENVSPVLRDALEDSDSPLHETISKRLKKSSGDASENTAMRLGVPFAGFEDMDEDEVLAAMSSLPSATIQAIKQYEGQGQGRERIVNYSIGFGESPLDRQEGLVGSDLGDADEEAAVARLTTREVPEEGPVQPGEGITGTGDPQVPYGSAKEAEGDDKPAARRSRRSRTTKTKSDSDEGSGSGSGSGSS